MRRVKDWRGIQKNFILKLPRIPLKVPYISILLHPKYESLIYVTKWKKVFLCVPNRLNPKSATKIQCFLKCLYTLANWIRILKHLKAKCCRSNGIWWEKGCFKKQRNKQCISVLQQFSILLTPPTNEKSCHQNYNFFPRKEEVVKMKWKASSFLVGKRQSEKQNPH